MNNQGIAISEIGAAWADYTFGEVRGCSDKINCRVDFFGKFEHNPYKESRKGIPFTYLLRDVLQFDKARLYH